MSRLKPSVPFGLRKPTPEEHLALLRNELQQANSDRALAEIRARVILRDIQHLRREYKI